MFVLICLALVWTDFSTAKLHATTDGIYPTRAACEEQKASDEADNYLGAIRYRCADIGGVP